MKRFLVLVGLSLFVLTATYATDMKAPTPFADVGAYVIEQAGSFDAAAVVVLDAPLQYGLVEVLPSFLPASFEQDATEYAMYVANPIEVDLSATSEPPSAIVMKIYAKGGAMHRYTYSRYRR